MPWSVPEPLPGTTDSVPVPVADRLRVMFAAMVNDPSPHPRTAPVNSSNVWIEASPFAWSKAITDRDSVAPSSPPVHWLTAEVLITQWPVGSHALDRTVWASD